MHTPDGSPCGLLNHLTACCRVVTHEQEDPQGTTNAVVQVGGRGGACVRMGGAANLLGG